MDLGPIKVHYVKHEKNGEKFDEGGGVETLPPRTENTSEGSTTTVRSTTTRERAQAFSTTTHKTTTSSSLQLKTVQRDEDVSNLESFLELSGTFGEVQRLSDETRDRKILKPRTSPFLWRVIFFILKINAARHTIT